MRLLSQVRNGVCVVALASVGGSRVAFADDFAFSAKVDKTTVAVGEPVQLTFTLTGDVSGSSVSPLQLPEGFAVMAQSRSTNFSIRAGSAERSMSLVYVLLPQKAGSFRLGPFKVTRKKQTISADAIEITVKVPLGAPPTQRQNAERYTL